MRCRILHESRGRMRVHVLDILMTPDQADRLQYYLLQAEGVGKAKVSERTGNAIIYYKGSREKIIEILSCFDDQRTQVMVPDHTGREIQREYEDKFFFLIARRLVRRFLLPLPLRMALTLVHSLPYLAKGLKCLGKGKVEVPVLDATTLAVAMLTGDFNTAGTVMFLLDVGDLLEEWTHKRSVDDLAQRMYLQVDQVWQSTPEGEVQVPISHIRPEDLIVVRTGNVIPLDGVVERGSAEVNQASMTGEALPVRKEAGSYAYAGTVLENGEIVVRVKKGHGMGRYDRIVNMIEESEKLKSATESRAVHLADKLVPFSLGGTLATWLLTRNVSRALAILMVDYSCALKLAMPVSVLSGMRECTDHHISVKGGKFLEAVAEAKTIIFDKTGTLTHAQPRVREVITFHGQDEAEMLRLAACLEEHFPHSMAKAVVLEAQNRNLNHEEKHTKVNYVVAHGIVSTIDGKRVLIGSEHFVFEDEKCQVAEEDQERFANLPAEGSLLFMALEGILSAVICVEDPVREEAAGVIAGLHGLGFDKIVMMTGDSQRTASAVASELGIDDVHAQVLPEDKAAFVRREHEQGRKVIMIGDGINDSPALSEADAGIAIAEGAAIAREIADITISEDSLEGLLTLRRISCALMDRINGNYRRIMVFNSLLILLGLGGIMPASLTALLHNGSTLLFTLQSMTNLLEESV